MRGILSIFIVLSVTSVILANPVALDLNPDLTSHDSQWLQYNNGTAQWFDWNGTCKAVWFDVQDFIPTADLGYIEQTEVWFYHKTEYPWDTSDVYIEIWNGNESGPVTQLDKTMATALHNMPTYVYYDPPLEVGPDYWCIVNSELSGGGWPSILADYSLGINHSFIGDATAWEIYTWGEYFIAVYWDQLTSLNRTSWGQLKTIF